MSTALVQTPTALDPAASPSLLLCHLSARSSPRRIDTLPPLGTDQVGETRERQIPMARGPVNHNDDDGESSSSRDESGDVSSQATSPSMSSSDRCSHRAVPKLEDFELVRVLGKGCAGKVLLVRHASTSRIHAMKAVSKRSVLYQGELHHTLTELSILKRMMHHQPRSRFISRLHYAFTDRENFYFVMRFYPGGDLATQLEIHGRLGAHRMRFYVCDIIQGLEDLHRNGIVVRDLKPENILLDERGHAVLADYGLSRQFEYRGEPCAIPVSHRPGDRRPPYWAGKGYGSRRIDALGEESIYIDRCNSFVGTPEYLAPETIQHRDYSYAVDFWALGCILYEGLVGQVPFRNDHDDPVRLYEKICWDSWYKSLRSYGGRIHLEERYELSEPTIDLLSGLLTKNPMERLTEPCIKGHEYFDGIDWAMVKSGQYEDPHGLSRHIKPVAEDNTRFFPTLHLDEEFSLTRQQRRSGEPRSPMNDDQLYALAQQDVQHLIDSFAWHEGMPDMDAEVRVNCGTMPDDHGDQLFAPRRPSEASVEVPETSSSHIVPPIVDASPVISDVGQTDPLVNPPPSAPVRAVDAEPAASVPLPSPRSTSAVQDVFLETTTRHPTVPRPAALRLLPDAGSVSSHISSLRLDSAASPGTPELVAPARRESSEPTASPIPLDDSGTATPVPLPFHPDTLDRPISYTSTLGLPDHLPSSGLSVSDVIAVPPSSGAASTRLLRRHNRIDSVESASINRLSVELEGVSLPLGDEDWEELGFEINQLAQNGSLPSVPNGSRPGSTNAGKFLSRFKSKPGEIVSSGLRRQVGSGASSRDTSPTKAERVPNTIRPFKNSTRKAFERIKAFPVLKRSTVEVPEDGAVPGPSVTQSSPTSIFKKSSVVTSPTLSSPERNARVPALSTIRSAFGLGPGPSATSPSKLDKSGTPATVPGLARRHTEYTPTVPPTLTEAEDVPVSRVMPGMSPSRPPAPGMMRSASEQVGLSRPQTGQTDPRGGGRSGSHVPVIQLTKTPPVDWTI